MSNGKGSKPRPYSITYEEYQKNWENVFRKEKRPKAETPKTPKTVKVAINKCYGGFSLSKKAMEKLAARKGTPSYFFTSEYKNGKNVYSPAGELESMFWIAATSSELTEENFEDVVLDQRPKNRADPDLIAVIEELGDEADGECASIKIVEIPVDVKWHIEEYDGMEWVAEDHKTWD